MKHLLDNPNLRPNKKGTLKERLGWLFGYARVRSSVFFHSPISTVDNGRIIIGVAVVDDFGDFRFVDRESVYISLA